MAMHGDGAGQLAAGNFVQSNATIAGTNITGTVASNGLSLSVGNYITTAMASNRGTDFVQATATIAGTNITGTVASNGLSLSVAAAAGVTLSRYEPVPFINVASTSINPASIYFYHVDLPQNVAFSNVFFMNSVALNQPGATSQNSTGTLRYTFTEGLTLFKRVDFGANSTNITTVCSGSFGFTVGHSYSSTSQSFAISWATDTAGGNSNFASTSSAFTGFSTCLQGSVAWGLPMITTLTAGEYFFANRWSSTTGTTNTNHTLIAQSRLGIAVSQDLARWIGNNNLNALGGHGAGRASAITTNNTMAISNITYNQDPTPYMVLLNVSTSI